MGIDVSITNAVLAMLGATIFVMVILLIAARRPKLVPTPFQNAVESLVQFIRDEIVIEMMGKEGLPWFPFIGTIFFFILFNNIFGLIPGAAVPTSRLSVTVFLALIVFFTVHIYGIIKHGFFRYFIGWVPKGLPGWLWPIVFILESISALAKPFSLSVRLFANMMADKIIVLVFLSFVILFHTLAVAPLSVPFAIVMALLELIFDIVQAYVFTILTAMYIGEAMEGQH